MIPIAASAIVTHLVAGADLQAAIEAAPEGSTITLASGSYAGPVHVDRAVTIEAEPGAELVGGGKGTVLTVDAADVTLRGLTVSGSGSDGNKDDAGVQVNGDRFHVLGVHVRDVNIGIDIHGADHGEVGGCDVHGRSELPMGLRGDGLRLWEAQDDQIIDNRLDGVRDVVVWYSSGNLIAANTVSGARYGTHLMHADKNLVAMNHYDNDVVGIFVMYSEGARLFGNTVVGANGSAGMGFGFKESDDLGVIGNRLLSSTTGLYLDGTPHRIGGDAAFIGNLLAYDATGVRIHEAQPGAHFGANDFHEDTVPVAVDGRLDDSAVVFEGNRWSDYAGYDLDDDGFGDLPYEVRSLSGSLQARHPDLAFFSGTPAAELLDLFAKAFPMFAPPAVARDLRPRWS